MNRTTHSNICGKYGHGIAYNVKVHHLPDIDNATEAQREAGYESAMRTWWDEASELAKAFGFSGVTCGGHSGGYLAPLWDGQPVGPDLFSWWGEGEHQEDFNAEMEKCLERFEAGLADLLEMAPMLYADEVRFHMEMDEAAAEELAKAKAERAEVFAEALEALRLTRPLTWQESKALADRLEAYA